MATKADSDREQELTRKHKLEVATALLLLLNRKVKQARSGDLEREVSRLRSLLTPAFLAGRTAAQSVGLESLERELRGIGLNHGIRFTGNAFRDHIIAQRAADRYANRWLRTAEKLERGGMSTAEAIDKAHELNEWRLKSAAITETSSAMGEARKEATKSLDSDVVLVRIWEATGDKNMCDRCERMDGKWIYQDEDWEIGDPGSVHPNCNCDEQIVPLDWVDSVKRAA